MAMENRLSFKKEDGVGEKKTSKPEAPRTSPLKIVVSNEKAPLQDDFTQTADPHEKPFERK